MSNRELWEEVSFQVVEEMDGSVRSGYFPTGEGLVSGNVAVDYTFGNFPIQPNDDRGGMFGPQYLGVLDSHSIAATRWNSYPNLIDNAPGSRNYMVTAAEYLGDFVYEFTSQNNLKVGDSVRTTNCPGFNGTANVIYADATKFRTSNEHDGTTKITGLRGRVDVLTDGQDGKTLDGGTVFFAPEVGVYNGASPAEAKVENYFNYLREIGVNPDFLKDFTFSGGDTEWDTGGEPNYDGIVLYSYIPADIIVYQNYFTGQFAYGSDFDGCVAWRLGFASSEPLDINSEFVEDFMVVVFSNDPRKNNSGWW